MKEAQNKTAAGGPGLAAGALVVMGFFLPMVRGCGLADVSAAQIATEYPEYYLYIVAGIVGIGTGVFLLFKVIAPLFIIQGVAGGLAFLHLVIQSFRIKANDDLGMIDPLGGYFVLLVSLGFLAVYPWIGWATSRAGGGESAPTTNSDGLP